MHCAHVMRKISILQQLHVQREDGRSGFVQRICFQKWKSCAKPCTSEVEHTNSKRISNIGGSQDSRLDILHILLLCLVLPLCC